MSRSPVPLIVRRTIPGSPERLFDAFSSARALAQWFTPSPDISVEVLEFDFKVAGKYRLQYTMANGQRTTVGGAYEIIERPTTIAMTWIWQVPDPLANVQMRVTFNFIAR